MTLKEIAEQQRISARYLQLIWHALQEHQSSPGPWDQLMVPWRALPAEAYHHGLGHDAPLLTTVRLACGRIRDDLVQIRKQYEPHFDNLEADGIHKGSQPFVLWKNNQYANLPYFIADRLFRALSKANLDGKLL